MSTALSLRPGCATWAPSGAVAGVRTPRRPDINAFGVVPVKPARCAPANSVEPPPPPPPPPPPGPEVAVKVPTSRPAAMPSFDPTANSAALGRRDPREAKGAFQRHEKMWTPQEKSFHSSWQPRCIRPRVLRTQPRCPTTTPAQFCVTMPFAHRLAWLGRESLGTPTRSARRLLDNEEPGLGAGSQSCYQASFSPRGRAPPTVRLPQRS